MPPVATPRRAASGGPRAGDHRRWPHDYQQPSDDQQDGERVRIDRELQEILPGAGDDPQDRDKDDDGNTDVDQQSEPPPTRRAVRRTGQQHSRRSQQQRFAQGSTPAAPTGPTRTRVVGGRAHEDIQGL